MSSSPLSPPPIRSLQRQPMKWRKMRPFGASVGRARVFVEVLLMITSSFGWLLCDANDMSNAGRLAEVPVKFRHCGPCGLWGSAEECGADSRKSRAAALLRRHWSRTSPTMLNCADVYNSGALAVYYMIRHANLIANLQIPRPGQPPPSLTTTSNLCYSSPIDRSGAADIEALFEPRSVQASAAVTYYRLRHVKLPLTIEMFQQHLQCIRLIGTGLLGDMR
jgi:hypothetical protein